MRPLSTKSSTQLASDGEWQPCLYDRTGTTAKLNSTEFWRRGRKIHGERASCKTSPSRAYHQQPAIVDAPAQLRAYIGFERCSVRRRSIKRCSVRLRPIQSVYFSRTTSAPPSHVSKLASCYQCLWNTTAKTNNASWIETTNDERLATWPRREHERQFWQRAEFSPR